MRLLDPSDEQEEGDTKKTAYICDSMDEEDRIDTIDILKKSDEWVIWKSKDNWSALRTAVDFHQLLYIKKDIEEDRNVGDPRLKDGGEQETFGSKSQKDLRMLGKKQDKSTTGSTGRHHNVTSNT